MQALTHCGSEFLTLSVEELEDMLRSHNSLGSPVLKCQSSPADKGTLAKSGGSRNPFNPANIAGASSMSTVSEPMSHIIHVLSLSWDDMQADVREYLNTQRNLDRTGQPR